MPDDVSDIAAYYDQDPSREEQRLELHQLEWALTWRVLERHLPPSGQVLDVGCGTGRYSQELARRGYDVVAFDLSTALLDQGRLRIDDAGLSHRVTFAKGDARNLSGTDDESIDAVLMLGPLYHLVEEPDRRQSLREAYRVLRPGGVIFSASLSRFGVLGDLMRRVPAWIEDAGHVRSYLSRGKRPDNSPAGGFRGYFAQVAEIPSLHEAEGFETLSVSGTEPLIGAYDESFNEISDAHKALWLEVLEEVSQEPSIIGASRHLLYVGVRR